MKLQNMIHHLTIPQWSTIPSLLHGFGTRDLTLNGLKDQDDLKDFKLVMLQQIHSSTIHIVKIPSKKTKKGDALITSSPNILLIIRTADCLPVFITDESRRVAAAVHCGWRGTAKKILPEVLRMMEIEFECHPKGLSVAFGPCIGQTCYEVGRDVIQTFQKEDSFPGDIKEIPSKKGKYLLDLKDANRQQLFSSGIQKENLSDIFSCSHCDVRFLSHRKDPKNKKRLLNFIGWKR
jgi:YfiH family protein